MKLYTKKEVAEMFKVSVSHITRLIQRNNLPVVRLGDSKRGSVRIDEADLEAWVNSVKGKSKPEVNEVV